MSAGTSCPSIGASLRVGNGESLAWDDVLLQYGTLVAATARSFHLQDADALDAIQMTWLRLAENAHRVQFPERLGGWLATTARNECLRIRRKAGAAPELSATEPDSLVDRSIGPEQRVIDTHITRRLWDIVAELPTRRRVVLQELFTEAPQPYAEVARKAGIPLGGIGPTRARALRQLRGMLDDDGLGAEAWR